MIYCKTEVPDVEVVDEDTVAGSFFELRIGDERVRIRGIGEPGIGQPVLLDGFGDATLLVRWLAANRTNRIGAWELLRPEINRPDGVPLQGNDFSRLMPQRVLHADDQSRASGRT